MVQISVREVNVEHEDVHNSVGEVTGVHDQLGVLLEGEEPSEEIEEG